MFENAILIASMFTDKQVREEKLPRLVFDEYGRPLGHERIARPARRLRFGKVGGTR